MQKKEECNHDWQNYESDFIETPYQQLKCSKCGGITMKCPDCGTYMISNYFLLAQSLYECPKCHKQVKFKNKPVQFAHIIS